MGHLCSLLIRTGFRPHTFLFHSGRHTPTFQALTSCLILDVDQFPGPLGFPIIGNIIDFSTKGVPNFCQELEPKYGKLFKFWFCSQPWVVVSDPEIARKLLLRFNTRPSFDILNVLPHSELLLQSRGLFITTE